MKKNLIIAFLLLIQIAVFAQGVQFGTGVATNSGSITTQNLVPAGTATAGSAVELALTNHGTATITVTGTYTGALSIQMTGDGSSWVTSSDATALILRATGVPAATISSAAVGIYDFDCSGLTKIRVTGLAAMTGTAVVTIKAVGSSALISLVNPLPAGTATIGSLSANQSTNVAQWGGTTPVTGGTAGLTGVGGPAANSAATSGNPVMSGGVIVPTTIATQDQTFVAGDVARVPISTGQQVVTKPFATGEIDWTYAAATSGIVNTTTAVTFKAASGTAGIRSYITAIQIQSETLGTATELAIRDGAAGTVIWRLKLGTAAVGPTTIIFPTPLKGTANTLLEVVTLTASTTGAVYFNAQGYTGF